MKFFKKLFQKRSLDKELTKIAEEYKNVECTSGPVGAQAHVHQMPSHNHVHNIGGYNGVTIPLPSFSPDIRIKRSRAVPEQKALEFMSVLDKKIAALIRARLQASPAEKESLSLSIDTLEMTRELVREVFIHQMKDE